MPAKKKSLPAANPVEIAKPMMSQEIALSTLAINTSLVLHRCFDLAADANISPDLQNLFWALGSRAVHVMVRIEQKWTWLLANSPPTTVDLENAATATSKAAKALAEATANPLQQNLLTAAAMTSSSLDLVDAMIDLVV